MVTCSVVLLNDCLQNTTVVCNPKQNPRQNSVQDKIQSETKFSIEKIQEKYFLSENLFCFFFLEKNCQKKYLSWILSQISSAQSEFARTNQCLSSLSGICIPQ